MNNKKANGIFLGVVLLHIITVLVITLLSNVYTMDMLTNSIVSEMIIVLPAMGVLMASKQKQKRVFLGFRKIRISSVGMIVLYTFLLMPLITLLNAFSMLFVDNAVAQVMPSMAQMPFLLNFFLLAIFAPFCEELVFRGVLYRSYARAGNVLGAALLSALLFGLMHMNFNQAAYAFALGIAMALLVEATGSLWSSILVHVVINGQSAIMMQIYGRLMPGYLTEGVTNAAAERESMLAVIGIYLVLALICTALAACVLAWMARNEGRSEYILRLLADRKTGGGRARLVSPALLIGVSLALTYMILTAVI